MECDSVDAEAILWIVGAPGVGKSCAAYTFASSVLDRKRWNVLWIHFDRENKTLLCIKLAAYAK